MFPSEHTLASQPDLAAAQQLLDQAQTIFEALGTLDEPARVEAARAALDHGSPIGLLGGGRSADVPGEKVFTKNAELGEILGYAGLPMCREQTATMSGTGTGTWGAWRQSTAADAARRFAKFIGTSPDDAHNRHRVIFLLIAFFIEVYIY
jgi:hypothetical protein